MGSHRVRSLPDASRRRVEALLPAALRAARQTPAPLQAAVRLFDLIETIAQRSAWPCWPNIPTRWRAWRAWWPPAPGPRST